jgi:hypothetical protein
MSDCCACWCLGVWFGCVVWVVFADLLCVWFEWVSCLYVFLFLAGVLLGQELGVDVGRVLAVSCVGVRRRLVRLCGLCLQR